LKNNLFRQARLRLTAFYAGSIILLLVLFSVGVFILFEGDSEGDFETTGQDVQNEEALQQQYASDARQRLLFSLIIVDLGTAAVAVSIGWFLAGSTLAPIQRASEKQERFISDAAHELRTPLSVMKAGLETIETGAKPSTQDYQRLNSEMQDEIERIVDLSNDLLFLTRSDQSAHSKLKSEVDISTACSRQIEVIRSYAVQKGVSLKSDIQPGMHIHGDEDQISRLIMNLLKNSVDYNREGGESCLVLKESNGKVVLDFSDNGLGMSREDLDHAFERFYKSDNSRERTDSGAGLGLSIVKEIVKYHGANINIKSQTGVGTTVSVIFNS
jgi:signal transduction histidine kinase